MNKHFLTRRCPPFLFAAVIAIGAAVIVGWWLRVDVLKSIVPGLVTMKPNTALGLAALGISGWLVHAQPIGWCRSGLALALTLTATILGLLTLGEYGFHVNFGIDEFFFQDPDAMLTRWPPGRPAPITGINIALIGTALIWGALFPNRGQKQQQGLILIAWLASFQALVGYVSGINYSFGSAFYTQIALHTALAFVFLCSAILLSRPNQGLIAVVLSTTLAGRLSRRLLLWAIIVPTFINWVQLEGERWQLWDADFGILLRVTGLIMFFSWLAFKTGLTIARAETSRKLSESEKNKMLVELQKAVSDRGELLSICSHEMRTPLTSLKLLVQIENHLLDRGEDEESAKSRMARVLESTERQVNRLSRLIDEMLDFSRISSGKLKLSPELTDISALAIVVIERLKPVLEEAGCKVATQVQPGVMGDVDPFRFEQVLTNLLANCAKYGAGGKVAIALAQTAQCTELTVQDEGIGIAQVNQRRIFEPYERAVSSTNISGLGLGLYISKQIVEAHRGSIKVASSEGHGALFTVALPNHL